MHALQPLKHAEKEAGAQQTEPTATASSESAAFRDNVLRSLQQVNF